MIILSPKNIIQYKLVQFQIIILLKNIPISKIKFLILTGFKVLELILNDNGLFRDNITIFFIETDFR